MAAVAVGEITAEASPESVGELPGRREAMRRIGIERHQNRVADRLRDLLGVRGGMQGLLGLLPDRELGQ